MTSETIKSWEQLSKEEKGALLLAEFEGKTIQVLAREGFWQTTYAPQFLKGCKYRVKPEVETVTLVGGKKIGWGFYSRHIEAIVKSHSISFEVVDGEVDCSSVLMVKLEK